MPLRKRERGRESSHLDLPVAFDVGKSIHGGARVPRLDDEVAQIPVDPAPGRGADAVAVAGRMGSVQDVPM